MATLTAAGVGAFLAANAGTIGTVATLAGTAVTAFGTISAGRAARAQGAAQQKVANFKAAQLDALGKEKQATARLQADQLARRTRLALSKLQTRAAGSGFSADDVTALAIGDEIAEYGTLQEQLALAGGLRARRGLEGQAAGLRATGQIAASEGAAAGDASFVGAFGDVLSGTGSVAQNYFNNQAKGTIAGSVTPFAANFGQPQSTQGFRYG